MEELDFLYNSELISIEISTTEDISEHNGPVEFMGYTIARAFHRDSGAKLGEGISLIKGNVDSAGSRKNWRTWIEENSIFRLKVPKELFKSYGSKYESWKIKEL